MRVFVLAPLVILGALAGGAPALAQPTPDGPPGAALAARAEADFQAGRYAEALTAFETLYQLTPTPAWLFAMGRCHQELGDCARATERFRAFLATEPEPRARAAAEERLALCAAVVEPAVDVPARVPQPAPPRDEPPSRRRLMLSLGGVGLGVGAVALTLELLGRGALDDSAAAGRAGDRAGRDDAYDRAQRFHVAAQVGAVVGVGCVAAAATLWWTRPRGRAAVAVVPRADGGAVVWSGPF